MNKTDYLRRAEKNSYVAPKCDILHIKTEGLLCISSAADFIQKGEALEDEFFEQIF